MYPNSVLALFIRMHNDRYIYRRVNTGKNRRVNSQSRSRLETSSKGRLTRHWEYWFDVEGVRWALWREIGYHAIIWVDRKFISGTLYRRAKNDIWREAVYVVERGHISRFLWFIGSVQCFNVYCMEKLECNRLKKYVRRKKWRTEQPRVKDNLDGKIWHVMGFRGKEQRRDWKKLLMCHLGDFVKIKGVGSSFNKPLHLQIWGFVFGTSMDFREVLYGWYQV